MATKKTIKKLLHEKWDKLTIQEKTYANTEYNKINIFQTKRDIAHSRNIIITWILLLGSFSYSITYNILKMSIHSSMAQALGLFAFAFFLLAIINMFVPKDEKEKIQDLEDWIYEVTEKRR